MAELALSSRLMALQVKTLDGRCGASFASAAVPHATDTGRSLDVMLNEDKACIRADNAAESLDTLRNGFWRAEKNKNKA